MRIHHHAPEPPSLPAAHGAPIAPQAATIEDAAPFGAQDAFERNAARHQLAPCTSSDCRDACAPSARERELLETVLAHEAELGRLAGALARLESDYRGWRAEHPGAPEPGDGQRTVGEILDDPSLSNEELCVRLLAVLLHEQPALASELAAAAGPLDAPVPVAADAPAAPASAVDPMAGLLGVLGMGASTLGGLLQNPLAIPVLSGACLLVPGLEPLALAVPFVAPIAGMALSSVGGMATQVGQGQAPQLGVPANAAAGAADPLLGLIGSIAGAATGAPANVPAPVLPLPAR
ncbi:MAG: hypothetical protein IT383_21810 [Deltaproteobacteria bacterium]|nr:hypothetical protein [Deltaproteobacteria bacterium]